MSFACLNTAKSLADPLPPEVRTRHHQKHQCMHILRFHKDLGIRLASLTVSCCLRKGFYLAKRMQMDESLTFSHLATLTSTRPETSWES